MFQRKNLKKSKAHKAEPSPDDDGPAHEGEELTGMDKFDKFMRRPGK